MGESLKDSPVFFLFKLELLKNIGSIFKPCWSFPTGLIF